MTRRPTLSKTVLATLLGGVLVLWGFTVWDSHRMRRPLRVLASEKVIEFRSDASEFGKEQGEVTVTSTVTAGREFAVYGKGLGKVSVFIRNRGLDGKNVYSAIEYYYSLTSDGEWINIESALCTDAEVRVRARRAFARKDWAAARPVILDVLLQTEARF